MREKIQALWEKYKGSLFLLLASVLLALCAEGVYNIPVWRAAAQYGERTDYELSQLKTVNMDLGEGCLIAREKRGKIVLNTKGAYVEKLTYHFSKKEDGFFNARIVLITKDENGNMRKEVIRDHNPYLLETSTVTIRKHVDRIRIVLPRGNAGIRIHGISTVNQPHFHGLRWLFFATLFSLISLLVHHRKALIARPERIFLVIGFLTGTLMVLLMPLTKAGLDEEVHFSCAYKIKLSPSVSTTEAIERLCEVSLDNWPENIAQSWEENAQIQEYYREYGNYADAKAATRAPTDITMVGAYNYIFMALGIKLGKLLRLPFGMVYLLGRLMNMWTYLAVVYFAIRRLPIGKNIMAVLALMPTSLFQAAVYSYDAIVTGFLFLGLSYLIAELIHTEETLTVKNGFIILASMGFGILPKAVFVHLLLLGFLIPASKFRNRKQRIIFRAANLGSIFLLMFTYLLPMLFAPQRLGDTRGGDVDVMGQALYVLHHPIQYLQTWLSAMSETLWSYAFGANSLAGMGHLGQSPLAAWLCMLILFVILTDNMQDSEADLTVRQKTAFFAVCTLTVAVIWGAFYLSYNEVGANGIMGVQGRYFIPLLFPYYLILRRRKLKNGMRMGAYYAFTYGCVAWILYRSIFDVMLKPLYF